MTGFWKWKVSLHPVWLWGRVVKQWYDPRGFNLVTSCHDSADEFQDFFDNRKIVCLELFSCFFFIPHHRRVLYVTLQHFLFCRLLCGSPPWSPPPRRPQPLSCCYSNTHGAPFLTEQHGAGSKIFSFLCWSLVLKRYYLAACTERSAEPPPSLVHVCQHEQWRKPRPSVVRGSCWGTASLVVTPCSRRYVVPQSEWPTTEPQVILGNSRKWPGFCWWLQFLCFFLFIWCMFSYSHIICQSSPLLTLSQLSFWAPNNNISISCQVRKAPFAGFFLATDSEWLIILHS